MSKQVLHFELMDMLIIVKHAANKR